MQDVSWSYHMLLAARGMPIWLRVLLQHGNVDINPLRSCHLSFTLAQEEFDKNTALPIAV